MTYKLFIDDERNPVTNDWVIARSSFDAIATVQERGMPVEIAFDHDLGGQDTSRVFIKWLLDYILDNDTEFPHDFKFSVHSQNPIGADWIKHTMAGMVFMFKVPHEKQ